jgi:hypothetical protein
MNIFEHISKTIGKPRPIRMHLKSKLADLTTAGLARKTSRSPNADSVIPELRAKRPLILVHFMELCCVLISEIEK